LAKDRRGFWGIVLAGAYPKGRSVFDRLLPRPLLPVVETPVVAYPLRWLAQGGVTDATVCANSSARAVRDRLEGLIGPGLNVDYSEDWMPRGAAGCVRDAGIRTSAHTFIVVDATTIPLLDMEELVGTHRRVGAALTVSARPRQGGGAGSFLSPNGIYVFDRRALDHIAGKGFQDIKEALIPRLHAAGEEIAYHECPSRSPRVFDAESYLSVNRWAISRLAAPETSADMSAQGYHRHDEAFVHTSSRVSSRARLVGPVVVGPGATVEDHATLVGPPPSAGEAWWRRAPWCPVPCSGATVASVARASWTAASSPRERASLPEPLATECSRRARNRTRRPPSTSAPGPRPA
jgi:NDP-sugar pyrophosphorylase family protein